MKVVRIVPELDFGGVEQVLANSLPHLANIAGMEVFVIVLGKGGRVSESLKSQGIPIDILKYDPKIPNFRLLLSLRKAFKEIKPDVVHCQGGEANFHGILAGNWAKVPKIIGEEIGIPNHHTYWKFIFKWVYAKADLVIAISEAVKNYIVRLGEIVGEKVVVVYNPVGLGKSEKGVGIRDERIGSMDEKISRKIGEFLRIEPAIKGGSLKGESINKNIDNYKASEEGRPFVFVTTCRLVPIKNLERLLISFQKLCSANPEKSIHLWIVGDGPLNESLKNQSKQLRVDDSVKFWGFQKDVKPFLINADVFVLPSLTEGSSVSLAEAMFCGLPSIVTKEGGASEILGESSSGILVDPLNVEDIFIAMDKFLNMNQEERIILGEKAKNESIRFDPKEYLKSLMIIYSQ